MQTQEQEQEELLTVNDVAKKLRVDSTTVRRWIKTGALPAITLPHRGNHQAYRIKRHVMNEKIGGHLF